LRVLFWTELFWPYIGGAQRSAADLILGLRDRGHEFVVVTQLNDRFLAEEARFKGIPVHRFPFYQALVRKSTSQLAVIRERIGALKRAFGPELVHVNCFGVGVLFHTDTAKTHPALTLLTLRGERYPRVEQSDTLLEKTLRMADWVTAPSVRTAEYARQLLPNFVPRISVIYNGIQMPSLPASELPFDAPSLLCLGRLDSVKGFDVAVRSFARVVPRFPKARLIIAGDGPERRALEQQVGALGLARAVDFIGWIAPESVPELINTSTMVLMPSRSEGFPLVALEAAAMGRPVVATAVGGMPEAVIHRETGWLVRKEDSLGLAQAVSYLLGHPEEATQIGQAARRRARKTFSIDRCVDRYDALYHELAEEATCTSKGAPRG